METSYVFYKRVAPRPDFHPTMKETGQAAMGQHRRYWQELAQKGGSVLYGPVFDAEGVFGRAVREVNEARAAAIAAGDPAIRSGVCTCQRRPMQVGMMHP